MGFALFSRVLSAGEIRQSHIRWRDSGQFWSTGFDRCEMLFPVDEMRGEVAYDRSGHDRDLEVRSDVTFLRRRAFGNPFDVARYDSGFRRDFLINLFGFVPFGFVLMGVRSRWRNKTTFLNLVIVIVIGFALSAGIEFLQSWFPVRNSSTRDLILNTSGGGLGALGWMVSAKILRSP